MDEGPYNCTLFVYLAAFFFFFLGLPGVCEPLHHKNWPSHAQCQAKCPPPECPIPTECNALIGSIQKTVQVSRSPQNRALSQCRIQEDHLSSPPRPLPQTPALARQPPPAWCAPPRPRRLPPSLASCLPSPSKPPLARLGTGDSLGVVIIASKWEVVLHRAVSHAGRFVCFLGTCDTSEQP